MRQFILPIKCLPKKKHLENDSLPVDFFLPVVAKAYKNIWAPSHQLKQVTRTTKKSTQKHSYTYFTLKLIQRHCKGLDFFFFFPLMNGALITRPLFYMIYKLEWRWGNVWNSVAILCFLIGLQFPILHSLLLIPFLIQSWYHLCCF